MTRPERELNLMFASYPEAAQALREAGVTPGDPLTTTINEARRRQQRYFAWLGQDMPPIAARRDLAIEGPAGPIPLRILYPHADVQGPVALFIRGAGWWAGDLDSHERTQRVFANAGEVAVCAVDYHRIPEHRYPVQKNEVLTAIAWLRAHGAHHGLDAARLVLWGESAGATLALSAAQALRDRCEQPPCGLILFYGNFEAPGPSARAYSHWVFDTYLGDPALRSDPGAVPMSGDMAGLPLVWLGVGEDDPLLGATLRLAEKLAAAGVPLSLNRYAGQPHAFVGLSRILDTADRALRDAAGAARRVLSANH